MEQGGDDGVVVVDEQPDGCVGGSMVVAIFLRYLTLHLFYASNHHTALTTLFLSFSLFLAPNLTPHTLSIQWRTQFISLWELSDVNFIAAATPDSLFFV